MLKSKILSIWKPPGITSFDVIRQIKNINKDISKVGHCGTLDPFAEGVLIVCIEDEVKNVKEYMSLPKTYIADIVFGVETDTLDKTGNIFKVDKNRNITIDQIESVLKYFKKHYVQSPPYYSAKKINGVKMYKLARQNIFIRLKGSEVDIYKLKILDLKKNKLKLHIECGAGTYVRSLARDIAYKLNTYAYVEKLVRTNIGLYCENNSINFEDIPSYVTYS